MKTSLALLLMTDGRPVLRIPELARLVGKAEGTVRNRISAGTFAIPTFKLDRESVAHVDDVANYIDELRAQAQQEHGRTK